MIRLSIITATYNREKELKKNIQSVMNQRNKNIEHIIVDNLSIDGTEQLVEGYRKKANYPVVYIRERDKGIYSALNKGITKARGEWIHILHSDGIYYSPTTLSEIFDKEYQEYDLIVCGIIQKYTETSREHYWEPEFKENIHHYHFPHTGTFIKREFFRKNGYYDERFKIVSDSIYNCKHYDKAKYIIIDKPLVIVDMVGLTSTPTLRWYLERVMVVIFYHKYPLWYKMIVLIKYIYTLLVIPLKKLADLLKIHFL